VPAGGIYQPLKNPLVNALLLKRREQDGSRLFNKRDGFLAPATFVKEGGLLIVVADQKVGRGGSALPFFNRLSSLSPLPALLARKAGAPVIAAGIETTAPGKWRVVFDSLGEQPTPTKIIAVLETLIRRSPADYLWLHNRWKLDGRYPLSVTRKAPKAESAPTARVRALVICRNSQEASTLTAWEDQKRPQDLPLSFEFLQVTSQPALSDEAVHQAVAPTSRELATQIRAIDLAQQSPLELVILDPPFPEALGALRLLDFPRVLENKKGLPLPEFLTTQTAPAS
jgi:KDO2-lipid IV(A) lauroyltransferase